MVCPKPPFRISQTPILISVLFSVSNDCWKIADFGTASEATSKRFNTTRYARGTPCYRAPEVLDEKAKYNNKADIWSLGCIIYESSTGAKAFSSDWAVREFYSTHNLNLAVPWPDSRDWSYPGVEELGNHLFKMLSIQPSVRPKAEELSTSFRSMTSETVDSLDEVGSFWTDPVVELFDLATGMVDIESLGQLHPMSMRLWPKKAWLSIHSMIWGHRISNSKVMYRIKFRYALYLRPRLRLGIVLLALQLLVATPTLSRSFGPKITRGVFYRRPQK
jgi:serine/threonine protein kinase